MPTRRALVALPSLALPGLLLGACGSPDTGRAPGACESGLLPGDLVITEIMVDPPGADAGREWFEIYNATPNELNLDGVLLLHSREDGTDAKVHEIGRPWVLPPDDYGVAGELVDEDEVLAALPYIDYGYADGLGSMRNSTGRLVVACGDDVIDEVLYLDPTQGASRGLSGERTPQAGDNDDLGLWCDATSELDSESLGTPGAINDICIGSGGPLSCIDGGEVREARAPAVGDVVITEVLANPEASEETDGEWFEVYIGVDMDLNGLAVGTDPTGQEADPVASNDCLPVAAGTRLVFARDMDSAINGGLDQVDQLFNFSLRNSDGQLVLSYGGEVLDEFAWSSTPAGASLNLDPDFRTPQDNDDPRYVCPATIAYGAGDLGSPGSANEQCAVPPPEGQCLDGDSFRDAVLPQPGDLVVTELLPNPDAVGDTEGEWFEIRAEAGFDLNGLSFGREEGVADSRVETEACLPIAAGSYAVFAREADATVNGNLPVVDGVFDFSLVNSNGLLWVGTDEATLDVVQWTSSSTGATRSLDPNFANPDQNDDEANWCDAVDPYGAGDLGTPGADNPACDGGKVDDGMCMDGGKLRAIVPPGPTDLVITEWMPDPDVVSDANGEWFEVRASANVDLNGLELSRISGGAFQLEATLASADCLSVTADSYLVFARNPDMMGNGGLPVVDFEIDFSLLNSNGGLAVGLGGEHFDEVTWESSTTAAATSVDPGSQTAVGNDDPANLCDATTPYGPGDNAGTPGDVNPSC